MQIKTPYHVFEVESDRKDGFRMSLTPTHREEGLTVYHAEIAHIAPDGTPAAGNVTLTWEIPMHGIVSTFTPLVGRDTAIHQAFNSTRVRSDFFFDSPFLSCVRDGHDNYATVAVSDAVNTVHLRFWVNDFAEQEKLRFTVTLPAMAARTGEWSIDMRIDERPLPMTKTMAALTDWFTTYYPVRKPMPPAAEDALYSAWYNFHQHPNAEMLDRELDLAAPLGLKTLIIDDGWQFDGVGTGDYALCGDWQVSAEKFPDLRAFVDRAHARGIKVMMWFCVPFVGHDSALYTRMKNRILYDADGMNAAVLDVRYADVRAYLASVYVDFIRTYDLDGLKLDFIDSFVNHPDMPPVNDEMDIPSLNDAVIALLEEIDAATAAVKQGLLFEYRQNYVGPAITRYGNMLRVADCAFAPDVNRIGVSDLRLLNYPLAVHSDMIYWAKTDTPDNVARQLLSVLFGVPQISVLLCNLPATHTDVLKTFLDYWNENRTTLLHGDFDFNGMDRDYPRITSRGADKAVTVLYRPLAAHFDGHPHDIFNATSAAGIPVVNHAATATARVLDMYGHETAILTLKPGAHWLEVPVGGRVEIR